MLIHIIEDDRDIAHLIQFNLMDAGYEVICSLDGKEGLETAKRSKPDLILLDLMLPSLSGMEICRMLKNEKHSAPIPIIMLTAKGAEMDIVGGLEAGAEDYITKPFSPKVLIARVKAVLRRVDKTNVKRGNQDVLTIQEIDIDLIKRKVSCHQKEIEMTYSEFQILHLFASHPGKVFTRQQIVNLIRGENHAITDRAVDVQIVGLRKKLNTCADIIETVRGVGYRLRETS